MDSENFFVHWHSASQLIKIILIYIIIDI